MPLPKYRTKISKLFEHIKDPSIREIISKTIDIEFDYRGSQHFPIRKIEDVVDAEARLIEKKRKEGNNEIY
jgi:hypothetical protein